MTNKVALVVDYQNTHLTAARVFNPNKQAHLSLINPLSLAQEIQQKKNVHSITGCQYEISRVEVYRGLPLAAKDPVGNSRNIQQKKNWEMDAQAVGIDLEVFHRSLKYYQDAPPSEKGVDIMCALALVKLATSGKYDTVVLSSRDTDLCPALEEAHALSNCKIEAVKWVDNNIKMSWGFLKPNFAMWTTQLEKDSFIRCVDNRPY